MASSLVGAIVPAAHAEGQPTQSVSTPKALEARGDIRSRRAVYAVPTPRAGQTTVLYAKVRAVKTPTLRVTGAGSRASLRRTTVVGGVKRLGGSRTGLSTYSVTVSVLKPRGRGATNRRGAVKVNVRGSKLRRVSSNTYTNAFTRRVRGPVCRALSPFDLVNRNPRTTVAFKPRVLYGSRVAGFRYPQNLGTYSLWRGCTGKSVQSYLNLMRGKRLAAPKSGTVKTRLARPMRRNGSYPNAVVLASGFMSQTPFTAPGQTCSASGMSAGGTWSDMQTALANDGFPVFTAPATSYSYSGSATDPTPVAINPSTMGMGTCAATQLPASMTMNTAGDFDTNSNILANFLNYLNENYGVTNVWLVGHSDGGLWSRGALDYSTYMPNISIQSITTIDTPWTGAWLANLGVDQAVVKCPTLDIICDGKEAALNAILNYFSPALDNGVALEEMTSTSMTGWNSRMAGVAGSTPFYAASAIGVNDPDTFNTLVSGTGSNPFYNPNDIAVGISSQQADGLVANGTISQLACFATIPGLHTELPSSLIDTGQDVDLINTYPGSTTAVTTNPMNITNVTNVLNGNPPTAACPSANYEQSGEYSPGEFGPWPDN